LLLTLVSVWAAEARSGGRDCYDNRAKRCLSASEFFSPRLIVITSRALQGTRRSRAVKSREAN